MLSKRFSGCIIVILYICSIATCTDKPNIVFILADDLGFNDCSFRGSSQIFTPNIDALAYSGIILNRYYVTPICTPSRSALMTGKYPIHTGMQHGVIYGMEPRGLPLTEKIMSQYLNDMGYKSHIVGKWHLGSYKRAFTPLYRGFDSHVGPWTGHHDYNDHTAMEHGTWGLDMRRDLDIAYDLHGKYSTDVFREESVRIIESHNKSKPLFLYISHVATHSGNPYNPLPAPDVTVSKLSHIENYNRRRFAGVLTELDRSVGDVVKALSTTGMLKNTIIVFSTDNGGPADGFNLNAASNWPLRGVKNTLWEGGVRGAGLIWAPMIPGQKVFNGLFHLVDWVPTLYSAAGGGDTIKGLDGIDLWPALQGTDNASMRREALLNIDDVWGSSGLIVGDFKLVRGTNYNGTWDSWYGPSGERNATQYDVKAIQQSPAGVALNSLQKLPAPETMLSLRSQANVHCSNETPIKKCNPLQGPCIFNIAEDPCEQHDLTDKYPNILSTLLNKLDEYNQTAVPPNNKPNDPRGDPRLWDYVWTNFGDYQLIEMNKV